MSTSSTDTGSDATIFNPGNVNLSDISNPNLARDVVCFLTNTGNEYNGNLGARISALFVILIVSSAATFFPVLAARVRWMRINLYVYLFARYFGAGVIVATAFIHLLDPAYSEIGPQTCVGMTKGWNTYSWVPALVLVSVMVIFLMELGAERYVESKYGLAHGHVDVEELVTGEGRPASIHETTMGHSHHFLHTADQRRDFNDLVDHAQAQQTSAQPRLDSQALSETDTPGNLANSTKKSSANEKSLGIPGSSAEDERAASIAFQTQIAAFLILEFGVIFHSIIIGLNLGTSGSEFSTLYPVLVFHQSFEGLGIGARMSAIPFPHRWRNLPWFLCAGYGLTTPVAIAIGLGLRTTYDPGSFTANVISGVLDSISAGILTYTGLVELLARDFLFDPDRTRDNRRLTFMCGSVLLGAALMALLGKWA